MYKFSQAFNAGGGYSSDVYECPKCAARFIHKNCIQKYEPSHSEHIGRDEHGKNQWQEIGEHLVCKCPTCGYGWKEATKERTLVAPVPPTREEVIAQETEEELSTLLDSTAPFKQLEKYAQAS
jgi:hypothetical protein